MFIMHNKNYSIFIKNKSNMHLQILLQNIFFRKILFFFFVDKSEIDFV